jgi:hypothetical protein
MSGKVSPVDIEFYDVKTRKKVKLLEKDVVKDTFEGNDGRIHYRLRTKTSDGRILTRFIGQSDWESLKSSQEKRSAS